MEKITRRFAITLAMAICGLFVPSQSSVAQQQPRQSLQLPSFSFFRLNSTLNVPDHGQAMLGSVKQSAWGSVSRGVPLLNNLPYAGRLFGNRSSGYSQSASTAAARVQIYNMKELDQALLRSARQSRATNSAKELESKSPFQKNKIRSQADFIKRHLGRSRR